VKSLGGVILARLTPRSDAERAAAAAAGIHTEDGKSEPGISLAGIRKD